MSPAEGTVVVRFKLEDSFETESGSWKTELEFNVLLLLNFSLKASESFLFLSLSSLFFLNKNLN